MSQITAEHYALSLFQAHHAQHSQTTHATANGSTRIACSCGVDFVLQTQPSYAVNDFAGVVRSASDTLNNAQIKALPTTPVEVLAAPPAGHLVVPLRAVVKTQLQAAYTNVAENAYYVFQMNGELALAPVFLGFTASEQRVVLGPDNARTVSGTHALTLRLINVEGVDDDLGDLTGGHAANTLGVMLLYSSVELLS